MTNASKTFDRTMKFYEIMKYRDIECPVCKTMTPDINKSDTIPYTYCSDCSTAYDREWKVGDNDNNIVSYTWRGNSGRVIRTHIRSLIEW